MAIDNVPVYNGIASSAVNTEDDCNTVALAVNEEIKNEVSISEREDEEATVYEHKTAAINEENEISMNEILVQVAGLQVIWIVHWTFCCAKE